MFENKKIFILGSAESEYEVATILAKRGNQIVLNDISKEQNEGKIKELKNLGVEIVLENYPEDIFDSTFDYLVKNLIISIDHKYVQKAKELGIEVINEIDIACSLLPSDTTLIAITGTNGKSTTSMITYEIIKEAEENVHLVGNIGHPLCGVLDKLSKDDIIVMDVSSQQLETLNNFHPNIAVMLNLQKAHLDRFGNYDNYKKVKSKIFQKQSKGDIAILNIENQDVMDVTKNIKSTIKYFSSQSTINGCYISEDIIYYYGEKIIDLKDIPLMGLHNCENIMASIMIAKELEIDNAIIFKVLSTLKGLEHRLEFVKKFNKRYFYNDSKSANINATQIALSCFDNPTILILGGMESGQNFHELKKHMSMVKLMICYGENKNRIKEFGDNLMIETIVLHNLEDAVFKAYELSSPDDVILFSPASSPWDHYKSFEERGLEYKDCIERLGKNCENS